MNWLLSQNNGAAAYSIPPGIAWHGCFMVLAWVVLMPVGFLVARFYKITPRQDWPRWLDNPFWFRNHRRLGYAIGIFRYRHGGHSLGRRNAHLVAKQSRHDGLGAA